MSRPTPPAPNDADITIPGWVNDRLTYCGGYRDGFVEGAIAMRSSVEVTREEQKNWRSRHLLEGYFAQVMCTFLKGPPDDVSLDIYCEEAARVALAMVKKMESMP